MRGNLWTPGSEPKEAAPKTALYLPGVSGNNITAPTFSTGTADLDLRFRFTPSQWPVADTQGIVSKKATDNNAFWILMSSTGKIEIRYYNSERSSILVRSPILSLTAGVMVWCRFSIDADNGAGQHVVSFYTSTDGENWTLVNSSPQAGVITRFDGAGPVMWCGYDGANYPFAGVFARGEIRSDGILRGVWNGSYPHTRQRDPQGNIWTVNGTANAWQKVV